MAKINGLEEFNIVGIVITLVLVILLLVLLPLTTRLLGNVFLRLTTVLAQSARVTVLRRRLLLPTAYKGVSTETAQRAEEYIANSELGKTAATLRRQLSQYDPLAYFPFVKREEKRYSLLRPGPLFSWVAALVGVFMDWFFVCIVVCVFQACTPDREAEFGVPLCLILAAIGAAVVQPFVFGILWAVHATYLRALRKLFDEHTGKPERTELSSLAARDSRSFVLSLSSSIHKGSLAEADRSVKKIGLDLEPAGPTSTITNLSIQNKTATPTKEPVDFSLEEDAGIYADEARRNDSGFIDGLAIVACGVGIFLGMFAGFMCFAISAEGAAILFVSFAFEFLFDTLCLRIVGCLMLALLMGRPQRKHTSGDMFQEFFLTRREQMQVKETQQQQLTEGAKLVADKTEKKELSSLSPPIQTSLADAGKPSPSSVLLRSHESCADPSLPEDEEICWAQFNKVAKSLDEFNRFLLRRIYSTYTAPIGDSIVRRWRDPIESAELLLSAAPEADVLNEASSEPRMVSEHAVEEEQDSHHGGELSFRRQSQGRISLENIDPSVPSADILEDITSFRNSSVVPALAKQVNIGPTTVETEVKIELASASQIIRAGTLLHADPGRVPSLFGGPHFRPDATTQLGLDGTGQDAVPTPRQDWMAAVSRSSAKPYKAGSLLRSGESKQRTSPTTNGKSRRGIGYSPIESLALPSGFPNPADSVTSHRRRLVELTAATGLSMIQLESPMQMPDAQFFRADEQSHATEPPAVFGESVLAPVQSDHKGKDMPMHKRGRKAKSECDSDSQEIDGPAAKSEGEELEGVDHYQSDRENGTQKVRGSARRCGSDRDGARHVRCMKKQKHRKVPRQPVFLLPLKKGLRAGDHPVVAG